MKFLRAGTTNKVKPGDSNINHSNEDTRNSLTSHNLNDSGSGAQHRSSYISDLPYINFRKASEERVKGMEEQKVLRRY